MNELQQGIQKAIELVNAEAGKLLIWRQLIIILQGIVPVPFILPGFGDVGEMDEHTADAWDDATFNAFGNAAQSECQQRIEELDS